MDQKLKERLVGMAVLLLLGFIFIPVILDGEPSQDGTEQDIELPVPNGEASHVLDFESGQVKKLELPKQNSSALSAQSDSPNGSAGTDLSGSSDIQQSVPTDSVDKSVEKAVQKSNENNSVTKKTTELKSGLTTINTLEKPGTRIQDEIERVAGDPSSAWVVQIGSFGDRNNAENEVQALKAKGFPAFLSRFVSNNKKVLYRVRVGPEKDRLRAEKLAESLKKAGINGQVVAHP